MDKEEFFERMLNRIAKDYGYDVASTFELLYMTKEKKIDDLQQRIDKAVEFVESMEYCGQEDYFHDNKSEDPCGNDNTFNDSKNKLLNILKGDDTNES